SQSADCLQAAVARRPGRVSRAAGPPGTSRMISAPSHAANRLSQDPAELRRLRLAIEASGEIIFMTDVNGTFTYVNPEFVRVYGYEPAEVIGCATPRVLKSGTTVGDAYAEFW